MLNHLRRRPPPPPPSPAAVVVVDDGYLACYGIVVACASLLLLTVLAATVSIGRACALAGAVGAAFGLVGCLARRWRRAPAAVVGAPADGTGTMMRPPRGAAVAVDDVLPPAFSYARPAAEGGSGSGKAAACPVCLEGVQAGEMVRRLPACGHLFHAGCIDAWLQLRSSRSTCPLCRRDVWAPRQPSDAKPARPEADPPDNNALPLPPV